MQNPTPHNANAFSPPYTPTTTHTFAQRPVSLAPTADLVTRSRTPTPHSATHNALTHPPPSHTKTANSPAPLDCSLHTPLTTTLAQGSNPPLPLCLPPSLLPAVRSLARIRLRTTPSQPLKRTTAPFPKQNRSAQYDRNRSPLRQMQSRANSFRSPHTTKPTHTQANQPQPHPQTVRPPFRLFATRSLRPLSLNAHFQPKCFTK